MEGFLGHLTAVDLTHLFLHQVRDAAHQCVGNDLLVDKLGGVTVVYLHLDTTNTHV